jgi:glutathione S-transferase
MVAATLKVPLNLKPLNLQQKEHLLPEFIKLNPQHTVPTLVDNNFPLWESRPICIYLVEKYAKDDTLYPKDPKKRAVVNQRLYFDMGTLNKRLYDYFYPQLMLNEKPDAEKFKRLEEAVELLDVFLESSSFVAGDKMTIADIAVAVTVSVIELTGYEIMKFPFISGWYDVMKKTCPGWDINEEGLEVMKSRIKK